MAKKVHSAPKGTVSTGNSPIADLASKTTSQVARGGAVKKHPNFTGQWFLERFVLNEKEETTRLDLIRQCVSVLDVANFKSNLDDMVNQASRLDETNGFSGEKKNKGPVYRTAVNSRSVLRKCYGALRFAQDEVKDAGYTETTGFHAFAVIAKTALEKKGIKWDGTKAVDAATKAIQQQHKREAQALADIKKKIHRQPNQSLVDYEQQCLKLVDQQLKAMAADEYAAKAESEAKRILELGDDMAKAVAEHVLNVLQQAPATV